MSTRLIAARRHAAAAALGRLLEDRDGLVLLAGGVGGVADSGQRGLVGRVEVDRLAEGLAGLLGAALGGQRVAEVAPGVGVVGPQLGDPPQLVDRVVGAGLDAGPAGQAQHLHVVRGRLEDGYGRRARGAVVVCLELRPSV